MRKGWIPFETIASLDVGCAESKEPTRGIERQSPPPKTMPCRTRPCITSAFYARMLMQQCWYLPGNRRQFLQPCKPWQFRPVLNRMVCEMPRVTMYYMMGTHDIRIVPIGLCAGPSFETFRKAMSIVSTTTASSERSGSIAATLVSKSWMLDKQK